MKAISASIVVFAAAMMITGGSHVHDSDTQPFVQVVGCIIGVLGLRGWFIGLNEK